MIKIFSIASTEEKLFSIYHQLDEEIIKKASSCNIYLIGGTALEVWMKYLKLRPNRKRSKNDLDFITFTYNPKVYTFNSYLIKNNFSLAKESEDTFINFYQLIENNSPVVEVDLLFEASKEFENRITEVRGIKLMKPEFLFASKFNRWVTLSKEKHTERYQRDYKDLIDLLQVISKLSLEDSLEQELRKWNFSLASEEKLNSLIKSFNKLYS